MSNAVQFGLYGCYIKIALLEISDNTIGIPVGKQKTWEVCAFVQVGEYTQVDVYSRTPAILLKRKEK